MNQVKKLALLKEEGVEFDDRGFLITKVNEKEDGGWAWCEFKI